MPPVPLTGDAPASSCNGPPVSATSANGFYSVLHAVFCLCSAQLFAKLDRESRGFLTSDDTPVDGSAEYDEYYKDYGKDDIAGEQFHKVSARGRAPGPPCFRDYFYILAEKQPTGFIKPKSSQACAWPRKVGGLCLRKGVIMHFAGLQNTVHLESNTINLFNGLPNTDRLTTGNFIEKGFGQHSACSVQAAIIGHVHGKIKLRVKFAKVVFSSGVRLYSCIRT